MKSEKTYEMTDAEIKQQRAVAIHESGHLVVAKTLGCFAVATLFPNGNYGRDKYQLPWGGYIRCDYGSFGKVIGMAGVLADHIYTTDADRHNARDAEDMLNELMWESYGSDGFMSESDYKMTHGFTSRDVKKAMKILLANWDKVEIEADQMINQVMQQIGSHPIWVREFLKSSTAK